MTIVIDAGNILYWMAVFVVVCLGLALVLKILTTPFVLEPRPRRRVTRAGLIEAGVWFVIIFGGLGLVMADIAWWH